MRDHDLSQSILAWYDKNARTMPWRVGPAARADGVIPDAYRIWLSEVMLQQTTVVTVGSYFREFTDRWPDVHALARAADADVLAAWAGLGYYARARNLLKCARIVSSQLGGRFPETPDKLMELPGIGPYTAGAIASIAYDYPATVLDGNVERVMARLFRIETPLPAAKKQLTERAAQLTPRHRAGDYAQAVMDLGATICTPRSPACAVCPWKPACRACADGVQESLPKKLAKALKPTRFGIIYVVVRTDGALLLEQRSEKGLLGGMLGWPGSDWNDEPAEKPPLDTDWTTMNGEVKHTFTHFHLKLSVQIARVGMDSHPTLGFFMAPSDFTRTDLPTVMRKAYDLARQNLAND